jgi:hypothetical protein
MSEKTLKNHISKKLFLCDSCANAEIKTTERYKTIYPYVGIIEKVQELSIWCNDKSSYVRKIPTFRERKKCHYRPKSGKIDNNLTQATLFSN